MRALNGIRVVALLEAAKGVLVLLAGFGLLSLAHHDVQRIAAAFVGHLHLDPEARYPRLFLASASRVTDSRLIMLAAFALLYSVVRLGEGYGLWFGRRWAEWLGVASGAIYIPIEVYELVVRISGIKILTLLINAGIVAYLAYLLWREKRVRSPHGVA